jgi:hypothetical protein
LFKRAQTDHELVASWVESLRSAHTRRNFEKTAKRFLEALPAGIRGATVEDVREALAKLLWGLGHTQKPLTEHRPANSTGENRTPGSQVRVTGSGGRRERFQERSAPPLIRICCT